MSKVQLRISIETNLQMDGDRYRDTPVGEMSSIIERELLPNITVLVKHSYRTDAFEVPAKLKLTGVTYEPNT